MKLENWKPVMVFRVYTKETKQVISYPGAGLLYKFGKYPCGACSKGVHIILQWYCGKLNDFVCSW